MNIEQQRSDFEAWYKKQMGEAPRMAEDMYTPFATACWEAYQAALESPAVQELRDALQEVVDAADGDGWNVLDAGLEKQRSALDAMEKQK